MPDNGSIQLKPGNKRRTGVNYAVITYYRNHPGLLIPIDEAIAEIGLDPKSTNDRQVVTGVLARLVLKKDSGFYRFEKGVYIFGAPAPAVYRAIHRDQQSIIDDPVHATQAEIPADEWAGNATGPEPIFADFGEYIGQTKDGRTVVRKDGKLLVWTLTEL